MCKKFNIPVDETPFTLKELMEADEVIVTSSGQFCMSACEIDGKPVGGKASEVVERLQNALLEEFLEETI
jgi:D-alanine transaminase